MAYDRLRLATRWPSDPEARLLMANLDIDFVDALFGCGVEDMSALNRIYTSAYHVAVRAEAELQEKAKRSEQ